LIAELNGEWKLWKAFEFRICKLRSYEEPRIKKVIANNAQIKNFKFTFTSKDDAPS